MSGLQRIALVIVFIGAINLGLIGFFQFDAIATIFGGENSAVSRIIYGIVGIAGLYCLTLLFQPSKQPNRTTEPIR